MHFDDGDECVKDGRRGKRDVLERVEWGSEAGEREKDYEERMRQTGGELVAKEGREEIKERRKGGGHC